MNIVQILNNGSLLKAIVLVKQEKKIIHTAENVIEFLFNFCEIVDYLQKKTFTFLLQKILEPVFLTFASVVVLNNCHFFRIFFQISIYLTTECEMVSFVTLCSLSFSFLQLNTDIETHVRSMSTRKRIPSKSTEDVGEHFHFTVQLQHLLLNNSKPNLFYPRPQPL